MTPLSAEPIGQNVSGKGSRWFNDSTTTDSSSLSTCRTLPLYSSTTFRKLSLNLFQDCAQARTFQRLWQNQNEK